VNKDGRYVLPYLPAVALISALGVAQIRSRTVRAALWAVTALYALVQFAGLSFGISARLPHNLFPAHVSLPIGGRGLTLYREWVHIASPPRAEEWRVREILEDVLQDSSVSGPRDTPIRLVVVPNRPFFEAQGFRYHVKSARLPVVPVSVTGVVAHDGVGRVQASDYVVLKTGDLGPAHTLQDAAALTRDIEDPSSDLGRQFVQIGEYALPDGSAARLYRHER
jgi:hypothetical protein